MLIVGGVVTHPLARRIISSTAVETVPWIGLQLFLDPRDAQRLLLMLRLEQEKPQRLLQHQPLLHHEGD